MTDKRNRTDWQKRKRVNIEIKRELQLWFLSRILGVSLLAIIIACILSYLYAHNAVEADLLRFKTSVRTVGEIFWPIFMASALTTIVAVLMVALLLPLKIFGPLVRLEKNLELIGTGDLTQNINVRSRDIFKEHATAVNMALEGLSKIVKDIKESGSSLETKITAGDQNATQKAIEFHKKQMDRIVIKQ
jgi:methyl-accepting chemotaxis protein